MGQLQRKRMVTPSGCADGNRAVLLATTALQATAVLMLSVPAVSHAQPAPNAHPMGGVPIAGSLSISQSPAQTTINQTSNRGAISWRTYNVGSQQTVQYQQPSASSVTLNRVADPNPSQIAGRINANGRVVLMNQAGVVFYQGAQVNTGGLMVTAASMSDRAMKAFAAGGPMTFDRSAHANARIENRGTITIGQAGLAALVAPQVVNSGVINARLGKVVLGGATKATLDMYGDGLLSIDVTGQVTQAPLGPDGKPATALVTNTGVIRADGGVVQLTARAADGVVTTLVDAGGRITADTVGNRQGTIALNGVGGDIVISGQLHAAGRAPGTAGGAIEAVADGNVTVRSTARINASGRAGGGVVAIGTTLDRARGGPSTPATQLARNVTVQRGAIIAADAITNGNGGHVAVLSSDTTHMNGTISARGGAEGGNGGFVETSGKYLGVAGSVDLYAPNGTLGTWLLDPEFLTVVDGGGGSEQGNFLENGGTILAGDEHTGTPDTIGNDIINSVTGDVVLQANQTLTVGADIHLNNTAFQSLVLEAGGTLTIGAGVNVSATGDVTLATGGAGPTAFGTPAPPPAQPSPLISVLGTIVSGGGTFFGGQISLLSGPAGTIQLGNAGALVGPAIVINAGTGGFSMQGNATLGQTGARVTLSSAGAVNESASATVIADTWTLDGGMAGGIRLLGTANAISNLGGSLATDGDLTVVDSANLALFGMLSANNLFFEVASPGGMLQLGAPESEVGNLPAALQAGTNGRISLVADTINVLDDRSTITTNAGKVELAPYSPLATSILGEGDFSVGRGLLSIIDTGGGALDIGGFTNVPAGAAGPTASAASITIDDALDLTGIATTLRLDATGDISQPGGLLTVGTLAGTGGGWTLDNTGNAIGALGTITATRFTLIDGMDLAVNGSVQVAGNLDLTAAAITIGGGVDAGTSALHATAGGISETGRLDAGTLTGNAAGAANLVGVNHIGTLGDFSASTINVNNASDLLIGGTLDAMRIAIRVPQNQITLGSGATIITGGSVRSAGPLPAELEPSNGGPGAYLQAARFVQVDSSAVLGQGGAPATLQISVTGDMQFDPPLGLQAPTTWLILGLTNGTATGLVYVNALDLSYTAPGGARLGGSIAGQSNGSAATVAVIHPVPNINYRFNGCIIGVATCIAAADNTAVLGGLAAFIPGVGLPPVPPTPKLNLLALSGLPPTPGNLTGQDVVPPNISVEDY